MTELVNALVGFVRQAPGVVVQTVVWGWHHPAAVVVLGMFSVTVGAFIYISGRSHRPRKES